MLLCQRSYIQGAGAQHNASHACLRLRLRAASARSHYVIAHSREPVGHLARCALFAEVQRPINPPGFEVAAPPADPYCFTYSENSCAQHKKDGAEADHEQEAGAMI